MLQLPASIRKRCILFLHDDTATLRALRLVNKALHAAATETLFRTVTISTTSAGVAKYGSVLWSHLRPLLHKVVVNTSENPDLHSSEQEEVEIPTDFTEAVTSFFQFPNLEELEIRFARECAHGVPDEDDANFEWGKAVAQTVANLQGHMDKKFITRKSFWKVIERTKKLDLQITSEVVDPALEHSIDLPALHRGFGWGLRFHFLNPWEENLTHLSLSSAECLWGTWPLVDLHEIATFERLKSFSLGNFTFSHDWQVDWIVSHAPTLETLRLTVCPVITDMLMWKEQAKKTFPDLPPLADTSPDTTIDEKLYLKAIDIRWLHIFDRFRAGLPHLRWFELEQTDANRYCVYDCGAKPSQWLPAYYRGVVPLSQLSDGGASLQRSPDCEEEDRAAFMLLLRQVGVNPPRTDWNRAGEEDADDGDEWLSYSE
ncbi:hypothetical protein NX059_000105 [Plenodomus lindquistii]|nr:hypothetical protein NX059_000105 [Plenodomus lindquistii]